ncbi:MAG: alpha/beta fold hydrolase [Saprospiraceae bacterium]|nr:alpha/beta fold hydrolase [Saprospiraceae bacterium]
MKAAIAVLLLIVCGPAPAGVVDDYDYPISNPYEATVIGTPPRLKYRIPDLKERQERIYAMDVYPERRIPNVLWHAQQFEFHLAYQDTPAPLIFIIAGTGANYRAPTMQFLVDTFYQAGFHVISLSSPAYYGFIATASASRLPGISSEDARDLYRVMKLARDEVQGEISITDYYLTGYSMGGLNSAFISYLDETEQVFGFKKVLLLNPPVNLYTASRLLDGLVEMGAGETTANQFFDLLFDKFSSYFKERGMISLGDEAFLFKFQESQQSLTPFELKLLIGAAFRFTAADIVFTSDLLNNSGYVIDKNVNVTLGSSLTPYLKRALWWRFTDYFDLMLAPYWLRNHPAESRDDLIRVVSLESLADYLRQSEKIGLITNADEIILSQADLRFLKETFGQKATIFPRGGHCGNIQHVAYVRRMLSFFRDGYWRDHAVAKRGGAMSTPAAGRNP